MIDKNLAVSERMALSVMGRYAPEQVKWHYEHGLVLYSIWDVGKRYGKDEYCTWVKVMFDTKVLEDGSIATYRNEEYNLDQINAGRMLFDLLAETREQKYRIAIEILHNQLKNQPRTNAGGFWHKKIYPWQMWLDGLYMAEPFYARYAEEFGNAEEFADICRQFTVMEAHARDKATGLLSHAWDESREQQWANPTTGRSPHFWGRALGWYCMAIADVIDYMPLGAERDQLLVIARRLVAPLLRYQDEASGLWYQVLDQGLREGNYLETSASSMFAYFLFKMARLGYLSSADKETALKAAHRAHDGLLRQMVSEDETGLHLHGICSVAGLGGNPYRDGSFAYYVSEPVATDDFKGVGPFILASLERERIMAR